MPAKKHKWSELEPIPTRGVCYALTTHAYERHRWDGSCYRPCLVHVCSECGMEKTKFLNFEVYVNVLHIHKHVVYKIGDELQQRFDEIEPECR